MSSARAPARIRRVSSTLGNSFESLIEEGAKGPKTSSSNIPKELPTIDKALKILASALKASTQAGLDKVDRSITLLPVVFNS
jgi:hypothetical protein